MLMSFTREVFALVKSNTMTMRIPIPIPLLKLKTLKYEWDDVGNTGYIEITATTKPRDPLMFETKNIEPMYKDGS